MKPKFTSIISLSPTISELIYDINAEKQLKGVTSKCVIPKYFQIEKTIVSNNETVDFEKIKGLNPDIIFVSVDDYDDDTLLELTNNFNVFSIDVRNIEDAIELITEVGSLLSKTLEAQKIITKIELQLKDLEKVKEGLLFRNGIYFVLNSPWIAAGNHTFISSMMELINVKNVFANLKERYPVVTGANIHIANPDLVFLPEEFSDGDIISIVSQTHDAETFVIDHKMFSWYGSRIIKAIDYLKLLVIKLNDMK
ncbi:MAG: ABC transporter substrate-binding protein [Ichthyobacteriaceae bacterium]|nr:ABC transporter substrate-binding protein [Ichthyobacteriaceae bacterium]